MRNTLLFVCAFFIYTLCFSQMTSKNGHFILPEAGDWVLQMNGVPFINMAMDAIDIMSDNETNANSLVSYAYDLDQVIVGKYFHDDNFASRYKIALNSSSFTTKSFGNDPTTRGEDDKNDEDVLLSKTTLSYWNVAIGYGHEYRRGHNRLQGFYGYEGIVVIESGNSFNQNSSTSYEFSYQDLILAEQDGPLYSKTFDNSSKNGINLGLMARAFVGIDYFIAPKIAIGAEFGWSAAIAISGRNSYTTTEVSGEAEPLNNISVPMEYGEPTWDIDENEYLENSTNSFGFNVDNMEAAINISFHF